MSEHHHIARIHPHHRIDHHLKPAAQQAADESAARLLADAHHPGRPVTHPHPAVVADVPPTLQELHEKYRNVAGGPQATLAAAKMLDDLLRRDGVKRS